ncbi:DNA repair exonuclease, partial [Candidatus Aerophobetes bacterium]|nr:DNA repair exonuclease [Candidatus Aerophobetes bacterium]
TKGRCAEEDYQFRDIYSILENDLFKSFMDKLEQAGYEEKRAEEMRGLAIKAMMEAGMREAEL